MRPKRPHVVAHIAVALDGTTRGFATDVGAYYGLVDTWSEDVTLTGAGAPWTAGVSTRSELELTHAEEREGGLVWLRYALQHE